MPRTRQSRKPIWTICRPISIQRKFFAPNALANKGLAKTDLKVGDEVQVKGYRSKNGEAFGYSVFVTLADGRTFQTGGAQDAPAAR